MSNILITGAGGAAAIALLKQLRGGAHELIAADMSPYAAGLYLVPSHRRLLIPSASAPDYVAQLVAICREHRVQLLIPTVDAELIPIARALLRFTEIGTRVLVAPPSALTLCLDKFALMRAVGPIAAVPRTELFTDLTVDDWQFPVIVKPRTGSGGRGVVQVDTARELQAMARSSDLIIQEFAPGEEYSVDVLATQQGEVVAAVPRIRLKVDSGVAVAAQSVRLPSLEELAARISRTVGITGVANLQFRRDRAGRPLLLEINPRFPGTMPLTVAAGVDMPTYAVCDILGTPLPTLTPFVEVAMVRTWDETYFAPADFASMIGVELREVAS